MPATITKIVSGVALLGAGAAIFITGDHPAGIALMVGGAAELGVNIAVP